MGEEPKPKTAVFSPKPWFWAKNCGFWLKTTVFGRKLRFLCGFQMWEEPKPKTAVSSVVFNFGGAKAKNRGFSAKNCSFQPQKLRFSKVRQA